MEMLFDGKTLMRDILIILKTFVQSDFNRTQVTNPTSPRMEVSYPR